MTPQQSSTHGCHVIFFAFIFIRWALTFSLFSRSCAVAHTRTHTRQAVTPALHRLGRSARLALSLRRHRARERLNAYGKTTLTSAAAAAAWEAVMKASAAFWTLVPDAWGGGGGGGGVRGQRWNDRAATESDSAASRRKVKIGIGLATVMAGAVLWLIVAPLLAAGLFETAFVVTPEEWAERGMVGALPWGRPLRTLALGGFLMHSWAFVCQVGLPRRVLAVLRALGVLQQGGIAGALGGLAGRPQFWQERMEVRVNLVFQRE